MNLEALTSAIYNNVVGGLKGTNSNFPFSLQQIEDEIIEERLGLIKEYSLKNLLPKKDLTLAIRCISLDCKDLDRCCASTAEEEKVKHFEVPQLITDFGVEAIEYVGPTDGSRNYRVYMDNGWQHHSKRTRGANKPYIWIDAIPNENNKFDAFLFNQPFLMETITIIAIFKDPRQLEDYNCCQPQEYMNMTFLAKDIKNRLTERYFRYFRQAQPPVTPNDLTIKP